jgi:F0F1-type ATP synthase epsilon subunit
MFGFSRKVTPALQVKVIDATGVLLEDKVFAVSSTNKNGPFDILEAHSNFITLIHEYLHIHYDRKQVKKMEIDSGVLRCVNNSIQIYLGVETFNIQ